MKKPRKAKNKPETRPSDHLEQQYYRVQSGQEIAGLLKRSQNLSELNSAVGQVIKFIGQGGLKRKKHHSIAQQVFDRAGELLQKQITSVRERDALPHLTYNLGDLCESLRDRPADCTATYAKLEHYIGRFSGILDQAGLFRILAGFSKSSFPTPMAFYQKLEARHPTRQFP